MASSLSEKDAVLRERAAFRLGYGTVRWGLQSGTVGQHTPNEAESILLDKLMAKQFPLPQIERARVVHTRSMGRTSAEIHVRKARYGYEYHYYADAPDAMWHSLEDSIRCGNAGVGEDIHVFAEAICKLMASPTELVPDEGSESDQEGSR